MITLEASEKNDLIQHNTVSFTGKNCLPGSPMRSAVVFKNCVGWLHQRQYLQRDDVGILICPALNRDALDSHHSLRILADAFAAEGYPTLRFDYEGAGDSGDLYAADDGSEFVWSCWKKNVCDAIDWLRGNSGVQQIIICGLRAGAMIGAAAVVERPDIAGFLFLAPVLRGHSYLRQIWIEAQLQTGSAQSLTEGLKFQELHFSPETVKAISQIDLRRMVFSAQHKIAIFTQGDSKIVSDCAEAWRSQGADVTVNSFDGLEPMLHHNLHAGPDPADMSSVLAWLKSAFPAEKDFVRVNLAAPSPVLRQGDYLEQPVQFGPDQRLFGILCQPEADTKQNCVIMANSGRDPHHGIARFSVEFARRLAAVGISSFRIDFSGLGDSLGPEGAENLLSPVFDTDRTSDLSAAADVVERLGYKTISAYGLCAGAFHVLHGAIRDERFKILILLNMPTFSWQAGDSIEYARHKMLPASYYIQMIVKKEFWIKFLSGRLDFWSILKARIARVEEALSIRFLPANTEKRTIAPPDEAHTALRRLSEQKRQAIFLFAPDDEGILDLERRFGEGAEKLSLLPGMGMRIVDGIDHMLTADTHRKVAGDVMISYLIDKTQHG